MTLGDLLSRVAPPASVVAERDWEATRRDLGIEFAREYREVVETFGRGYLEPGVVLWDPRSSHFEGDISVELRAMADPDVGYPGNGQPYPPYPGPGRRLLPVAADGSAGYVMAVIDDGVQVELEYWVCDLDDDDFTKVRSDFAGVLIRLADDPAPDLQTWRFGNVFHPL